MTNLTLRLSAMWKWLRPTVTTSVTVGIGLTKFGITKETYDLCSVGDLQSWEANSRSYPQYGIIENRTIMWRWQADAFETRRKIASDKARATPLTLRRSPSKKDEFDLAGPPR